MALAGVEPNQESFILSPSRKLTLMSNSGMILSRSGWRWGGYVGIEPIISWCEDAESRVVP